MGRMTKEELSQIHWLNKEITMWQRKLESLENQSLVKGQQITGMPSGGSRTTSKVEDRVMRLVEIRERIQNLRDKAEREQVRLLNYIEGIEDGFVRQIIVYRFVEDFTWKEVARKLGGNNSSESVRKAFQRFLQKESQPAPGEGTGWEN